MRLIIETTLKKFARQIRSLKERVGVLECVLERVAEQNIAANTATIDWDYVDTRHERFDPE